MSIFDKFKRALSQNSNNSKTNLNSNIMANLEVNVVKGEKVDLTKGKENITTMMVGGGWDINPAAGGRAYDLDIFAIGLGADKKPIPGFVTYFGGLEGIAGVRLNGDNLTGEGDGDDEVITLTLGSIPETVQELAICINIYDAVNRSQRFGMVQNSYVRVFTETEDLIKYDLNEDFGSATGVITGKVYRHNGEWKFEAIGIAFEGTINDAIRILAS